MEQNSAWHSLLYEQDVEVGSDNEGIVIKVSLELWESRKNTTIVFYEDSHFDAGKCMYTIPPTDRLAFAREYHKADILLKAPYATWTDKGNVISKAVYRYGQACQRAVQFLWYVQGEVEKSTTMFLDVRVWEYLVTASKSRKEEGRSVWEHNALLRAICDLYKRRIRQTYVDARMFNGAVDAFDKIFAETQKVLEE